MVVVISKELCVVVLQVVLGGHGELGLQEHGVERGSGAGIS